MNEDEYKKRLNEIDNQLDDLLAEQNKRQSESENQLDDDFNSAKKRADLYSENYVNFKITNQRIIDEIETLKNKASDKYPIDTNKMYDALQEKLNKFRETEAELQDIPNKIKQQFLNNEDEFQLEYLNKRNAIEDIRDDLKDEYFNQLD